MDKVEVREIRNKGKGVFAKKDFKQGKEILIFKGSKILKERKAHTLQIGPNRHLLIDEPWRYVNHSCNPNCGIKDKIKLVAMRPIKKREEIIFDYAMTESHLPGLKCLCGSSICRGRITGFDKLPKEFKDKYKGFISDYLL